MSINTIVDGVTYAVPETGERGWGTEVTNLLVALGNNSLLIKGGSIPLTSDADFGANFGLVSIYFKSRSANIASTGVLRLANADDIAWRNGANDGDLVLDVASDRLQFEAVDIPTISSTDTLTNKTLTSAVLLSQVTGNAIETNLAVSALSTKLANAEAIKTYIDDQIADNDDASEITYTPTGPGNWPDPDPATVQAGLDQLAAERALKAITITGAGSLTGGGDLSSNRTIDVANGGINTDELANSGVTSAKLEDNITLPGSGSVTVPTGNTAGRVATAEGSLRRNNETSEWEGYNGTSWENFLMAGAVPAADVTYDNSTSGLTATDVQAAIDEVDGDVDAHVNATSAHGATGDLFGLGDNPQFTSNESIKLPTGTTAQRPGAPAAGQIRYNSDDNAFEGYDGTIWGALGGGGLTPSVQTSSFTAESGNIYLVDTSSGDVTVTLPNIAAGVESIGILLTDATNQVIVNADASDTIDGATTFTLSNKRDWRTLHSDGVSDWKEQRPSSGAGAIITGWTDFTPTGSWTNTTYTGKWRRVGSNMVVQTKATLTGTPTGGVLSFNIPSGFTINSADLLTFSALGVGWTGESGVSSEGGVSVAYTNSTTVSIYGPGAEVQPNSPFTYGVNDTVTVIYTVPILEWQNSGTTVTLQDLTAKTKWVDNTVLDLATASGGLLNPPTSVNYAFARCTRDSNDEYWLEFSVSYGYSSGMVSNWRFAGATVANNYSFWAQWNAGGSQTSLAYSTSSAMQVNYPANAAGVDSTGRIKLTGKPSWFDANLENSQSIDAQVESATSTTAGLLDRYQTETKALDNNFTTGNVTFSRVNNVVTVTFDSTASHANAVSATCSSGFVPSDYRPGASVNNVYGIGATGSYQIQITSGGDLTTSYRNWSGSTLSTTSSVFPAIITYSVD